MGKEYYIIQNDTDSYYVYVDHSGFVVWDQDFGLAHQFSTLLGASTFASKLKQTYKVQGRLALIQCTQYVDTSLAGTVDG